MKFKFLTGDINWWTFGGKFISRKFNNGEFDYWLVLEVLNWNEHERNPKETYNVSLSSVSPSEAGEKNLKSACDSCGFNGTEDFLKDPIAQVDILHSYGVHTPVWSANGNNLKKLLREAHRQAVCVNGLYGFYMDQPVNSIGTPGWDAQKGNILAGLNKGGAR